MELTLRWFIKILRYEDDYIHLVDVTCQLLVSIVPMDNLPIQVEGLVVVVAY